MPLIDESWSSAGVGIEGVSGSKDLSHPSMDNPTDVETSLFFGEHEAPHNPVRTSLSSFFLVIHPTLRLSLQPH